MRWFGESWDAPVNEASRQTDVPLGRRCFGCGEDIVDGDAGYLIPAISLGSVAEEPWHRGCFHREMGLLEVPDSTTGYEATPD